MFSYKICYTDGIYNYLVEKITSCSKANDYWDSLTILFINYSLKLSSFYLDFST